MIYLNISLPNTWLHLGYVCFFSDNKFEFHFKRKPKIELMNESSGCKSFIREVLQ